MAGRKDAFLSPDHYDYYLPACDIAQEPCSPRDASRLLVLDRCRPAGSPDGMEHRRFHNLPDYLEEGDCLVINHTRVIPARLRGFKVPTGGAVEVFLSEPLGDGQWKALLRPGRRLRPGSEIALVDPGSHDEISGLPAQSRLESIPAGTEHRARVLRREPDGVYIVSLQSGDYEALDQYGSIPLPPYIGRPLGDPARYQTVYAQHPGSVAAPTAGLHFTTELVDELRERGVRFAQLCLHIGLGTFQPVRASDIREHQMHEEYVEVSREAVDLINDTRARGGRAVAVGTTAVRALESATNGGVLEPFSGKTDLFIYPGYRYRVVDALITNFHLPRSTLLMLVSALVGRDRMMAAYREARRRHYRFYSFGDAMFIT